MTELAEAEVKTRERISDVLRVYPGVSLSMLYPALTSYDREWRLIFEHMLADGLVEKRSTYYKGKLYYKYFLAGEAGDAGVLDLSDPQGN